jgi:LPXTG-motif cell wall-anchored protein
MPPNMRCRFCDTEIAAKALICYRCGRATTDPRVAPPPARRGPTTAVMAAVVVVAAGAAAFLPEMADGTVLWSAWAGLTALAGATAGLWWRRRR